MSNKKLVPNRTSATNHSTQIPLKRIGTKKQGIDMGLEKNYKFLSIPANTRHLCAGDTAVVPWREFMIGEYLKTCDLNYLEVTAAARAALRMRCLALRGALARRVFACFASLVLSLSLRCPMNNILSLHPPKKPNNNGLGVYRGFSA